MAAEQGSRDQKEILQSRYNNQLDSIGFLYGADLSTSRGQPIEEVLKIRELGRRLIDWLSREEMIDDARKNGLTSQTDNYFILDEQSHKNLGIAKYKRTGARFEKELKAHKRTKNALGVAQASQIIEDQQTRLEDWFNNPIPLGSAFEFKNGNKLETIVAVRSSVSSDLSLEGITAEETMHCAAKIYQWVQHVFPMQHIQMLEETAVKYYAIEGMKACNVNDEVVGQYRAYGEGRFGAYEDFWRMFRSIQEPGAADRIFFQGVGTTVQAQALKEAFNVAVNSGSLY